MRIVEACSCGARIDAAHNYTPSVTDAVEKWRETHRHTEPVTLEPILMTAEPPEGYVEALREELKRHGLTARSD